MSAEDGQQEQRRTGRWNQLSLIMIGVGLVAFAAAAVLFVLSLGDEKLYSGPETATPRAWPGVS